MKQGYSKRLDALEAQTQPQHRAFEVWVGTGEDDMLGPDGEVISLAEFERRYPDAIDIGGPLPVDSDV